MKQFLVLLSWSMPEAAMSIVVCALLLVRP
jgi:hypothetical protein